MPALRIYFDKILEGAAPKVPRQDLTHVERLALVRRRLGVVVVPVDDVHLRAEALDVRPLDGWRR